MPQWNARKPSSKTRRRLRFRRLRSRLPAKVALPRCCLAIQCGCQSGSPNKSQIARRMDPPDVPFVAVSGSPEPLHGDSSFLPSTMDPIGSTRSGSSISSMSVT